MALNITYERSPLADLMADLPKLLLQYQMSMTEMEREVAEAARDRAFRRDMMENEAQLNLLSSDYQFQRQRLATLEDELAVEGYQLPKTSKTTGFGDIKDRTKEGYELALQDTLTSIGQVNKERALIKAGQRFIRSQEDLYGGLVTAGKDEAWKDFMLEGGLTYDPDKAKGEQFTGTEEMAVWINELSDEDLDRLKSENFRRAVLEGRRSMEEAQEAAVAGQQFEVNRTAIAFSKLQIEKATNEIREGNYDAGMKRLADVEKDYDDRMLQAGLGVLSSLNMVTADGQYSINYLQMLEDPDKYIEIMEDFIEANPEIATEIIAIKDRFILAKQEGVDWSEPVLRTQANAYSDFIEARKIEEVLGEGDRSKGIKAIRRLPASDPTKSRYTYLETRINQFKKAGLYGSGRNVKEMEANLVNAYQLIGAKDKLFQDRIEADMEYLSKIAKEGYPVELSDFAPTSYEGMSAADQEDLLVSMELLRSFKTGDDGESDLVNLSKEQLKSELSILNDKAMLISQGFETDISVEDLKKKAADIGKQLRSMELEEIRSYGEVELQEVLDSLVELGLPVTEYNIEAMTGRKTPIPFEEAPGLGF